MFTTLIVQPIFNLLALIYALLPGHNFGLAIIIFTIIIRLLLWPLVKKQLHHTKQMRKLQPDLKRIANETKGDRQQRAALQMELYKERGINPFGGIGVALLQLPILFGLYLGLQRVSRDNQEIVNFSYPFVQELPGMQRLAENIELFDASLFGLVDLQRAALTLSGFNIYVPALIIVVASVVVQYFQAKHLMPNSKDGRSLRAILKDAGEGKQADQTEMTEAISRSMVFMLPAIIFVATVTLASALSLYWFVGGLVAFIQQAIVLREDKTEMQELTEEKSRPEKGKKETASDASKEVSDIPEAEVVYTPAPSKPKRKKSRSKKRRRK